MRNVLTLVYWLITPENSSCCVTICCKTVLECLREGVKFCSDVFVLSFVTVCILVSILFQKNFSSRRSVRLAVLTSNCFLTEDFQTDVWIHRLPPVLQYSTLHCSIASGSHILFFLSQTLLIQCLLLTSSNFLRTSYVWESGKLKNLEIESLDLPKWQRSIWSHTIWPSIHISKFRSHFSPDSLNMVEPK